MTSTRVAILGHTAQLGGAEIAMLRLVQELPDEWEISVILFAPGDLEERLQQRGIAVEVLPLAERTATRSRAGLSDPRAMLIAAWDSLTFTGELARLLTDLGAELVVANSLKAAVLAGAAAARARLPWVWHLHDRLSADYLPAPAVPAMRLLARRARHVVANSQQTAQLTRLPASRVTVAYPGVPTESFISARPLPAPGPVFGLVGRISSTKGQREFIQAAALVAAAHPAAEFRIIGEALFNDQAYAREVRALPAQLGIADRVRFTGWSANPAGALDQCAALVHASPVPEPFGQVIVEAMARRVPVIATSAGGVGEILTGSANPPEVPPGTALRTRFGQLVRPADPQSLAAAMTWVLENPAEAAATAEIAAETAAHRFSVTATVAACQAAWRKALAAAQPRRRWSSRLRSRTPGS